MTITRLDEYSEPPPRRRAHGPGGPRRAVPGLRAARLPRGDRQPLQPGDPRAPRALPAQPVRPALDRAARQRPARGRRRRHGHRRRRGRDGPRSRSTPRSTRPGPDANCVVHTHMPYATALALTEEGLDTRAVAERGEVPRRPLRVPPRLRRAVHCRPTSAAPIAEQIAAGVRVVLLRNHGVLVVGETVARAWWDLYFFERAAMVQVLAGVERRRAGADGGGRGRRRSAAQFEDERRRRPDHVGRRPPSPRSRAARLHRLDGRAALRRSGAADRGAGRRRPTARAPWRRR